MQIKKITNSIGIVTAALGIVYFLSRFGYFSVKFTLKEAINKAICIKYF